MIISSPVILALLCRINFWKYIFKEKNIFILAVWYSVNISFFSVRCLRNHLKTVHLEEKPFKCKFCNCQTSFASEGRLTTHVVRVHGKKMVRLTRLIYEFKNSNRKKQITPLHSDTCLHKELSVPSLHFFVFQNFQLICRRLKFSGFPLWLQSEAPISKKGVKSLPWAISN